MGMKWIIGGALLGLAGFAAPAMAQDAAAGEKSFAQCKACHSLEQGKKGVGPSLFGVVGRKAASTDFAYSDAMKNSGMTWTEENLDKYLTDPKAAVPGNKMVFPGVKDATVRQNIIAYLKTIK